MSGYEALRWELLEIIDPWGPKRADYQAARIVWAIANVFGGKMSFKKILKLFNFAEVTEQTDKEIEQIFIQIAGKK